jgi:bifunctional DNA-binding transcriptional regulator/antitoxin component of YhaV-PrlF toxin-antitoxin module
MVFRVQVIDGQYVIVIPADAMTAMGLREGSAVEVLAVSP